MKYGGHQHALELTFLWTSYGRIYREGFFTAGSVDKQIFMRGPSVSPKRQGHSCPSVKQPLAIASQGCTPALKEGAGTTLIRG